MSSEENTQNSSQQVQEQQPTQEAVPSQEPQPQQETSQQPQESVQPSQPMVPAQQPSPSPLPQQVISKSIKTAEGRYSRVSTVSSGNRVIVTGILLDSSVKDFAVGLEYQYGEVPITVKIGEEQFTLNPGEVIYKKFTETTRGELILDIIAPPGFYMLNGVAGRIEDNAMLIDSSIMDVLIIQPPAEIPSPMPVGAPVQPTIANPSVRAQTLEAQPTPTPQSTTQPSPQPTASPLQRLAQIKLPSWTVPVIAALAVGAVSGYALSKVKKSKA
jgi:hypothetical protein